MHSVASMLATHHALLLPEDALHFTSELGSYCLEMLPSDDPILHMVFFTRIKMSLCSNNSLFLFLSFLVLI